MKKLKDFEFVRSRRDYMFAGATEQIMYGNAFGFAITWLGSVWDRTSSLLQKY